jgi:hypothetical protein
MPISRSAMAIFATFAAVFAVAGCTREITGTARAEPPPHTVPDLSGFTDANLDQYYVPLRGGPSYQFATPSGLHCELNGRGPWCSGKFSSNAYGPSDDVCSLAGHPNSENAGGIYTIERADDECRSATPDTAQLLGVGQKLTVDWPGAGRFACGVGPANRVACLDGNHGFVVEPTGAWTF